MSFPMDIILGLDNVSEQRRIANRAGALQRTASHESSEGMQETPASEVSGEHKLNTANIALLAGHHRTNKEPLRSIPDQEIPAKKTWKKLKGVFGRHKKKHGGEVKGVAGGDDEVEHRATLQRESSWSTVDDEVTLSQSDTISEAASRRVSDHGDARGRRTSDGYESDEITALPPMPDHQRGQTLRGKAQKKLMKKVKSMRS